jgi:hypothetical protein
MLRRLLLGLFKGSLVGGLLAYALVAGLSVQMLSGGLAYAAVVLVGVVTALVAGRPIWAAEARIEVLLKSIAAALLGSALFFLLTRYLPIQVAWGPIGTGALTQLPYVLLPTVSILLSLFFEVDNDGSREENPRDRESVDTRRLRVDDEAGDDSLVQETAADSPQQAKRR